MSDTKVMSIFATKGGVGKTGIAVATAFTLSKRGKTLLLELDSNFSVSTLLRIKKNLTIYDVVQGHEGKLYRIGKLHILSSDGRTAIVEKELQEGKIEIKNLLDLASKYRYVVVDHHNAFSLLTTSILEKSAITVVPLTPDALSLGAYFHTHKVLSKLQVRHKGLANRVHMGIFGIPEKERKILDKAASETELFSTLLPEIRRVRGKLHEEKKFVRGIEKFVEELKEVI